ncbi:MAG: site-specific integrase [Planctomycetota bacterium]
MSISVQLTKRGQQVYTLRWTDRKGSRKSRAIGRIGSISKAKAEEVRASYEAQLNHATIFDDPGEPFTLEDLLRLDGELTEFDLQPKTRQAIRHAVAKGMASLGPDTNLRDIGPADVERIKRYILVEEGLSLATWGKTLRHLRSAVNRAIKHGALDDNPFSGQKVPPPESRSDRVLSRDEFHALVDANPRLWWKALLYLLTGCGLRLGEALNLRWKDVDRADQRLLIRKRRQTTLRLDDGRTLVLPAWSPKSGKNREVPADPQTLAVLETHRITCDGSPYVLLSLERLARITKAIEEDRFGVDFRLVNNLQKNFRRQQLEARALLAERLGCSVGEVEWERVSFHDLRRTYCTWMAQTLPMHVLQAFAGHTDIRTTMTFYTKVRQHDEDTARSAFASLFTATEP